jgi:ribosomal protein L21
MDYAIVKFGNKQFRVRDGETLVVDRVRADEGKSFEPTVLLGEGKVTATVVAHERGPKIRIGKYRRRTGYRRHTGFRAATSRVQISLGSAVVPRPRAAEPKAETAAKPEAQAAPKPKAETVAKPKAETVAKPEAETVAKPKAETVAKPKAETVAKPKAETVAKPKAETAATPKAEAAPKPKAETAAKTKAESSSLPKGYDELAVWEVKEQAEGWSKAQLEAALAHEQANAARKGAIAVLEAALEKEGH